MHLFSYKIRVLYHNVSNVQACNAVQQLTHYHTILHFDALKIHVYRHNIAVENIVRKGKIACNKKFFSFSHNVFYPIWYLFFTLNAL